MSGQIGSRWDVQIVVYGSLSNDSVRIQRLMSLVAESSVFQNLLILRHSRQMSSFLT